MAKRNIYIVPYTGQNKRRVGKVSVLNCDVRCVLHANRKQAVPRGYAERETRTVTLVLVAGESINDCVVTYVDAWVMRRCVSWRVAVRSIAESE